MPFNFRQLEITLKGETAEGKGWVFLIGCGAASVSQDGCANTQHTKRLDPVSMVSGFKTEEDLIALKLAVKEELDKLEHLGPKPAATKQAGKKSGKPR